MSEGVQNIGELEQELLETKRKLREEELLRSVNFTVARSLGKRGALSRRETIELISELRPLVNEWFKDS